ncbi:MAG: hypothetical protein WCD44_03990 [Candidatus Babeliales bacterium]
MKKIILILATVTSIQLIQTSPVIQDRVLGNANWGTHQTPLITAVMNTEGPVLEMGCGDFSTPLLHAICTVNQRTLVSSDADKEWLTLFLDLETSWHHFIYVPVFENTQKPQENKWNQIGNNTHWSIVFIDHSPGTRRAADIKRLRSHTDIFVVHDTEKAYKDYRPVLASFKYKFVYKRYKKQTTVVSDTIDVATFFK